MAALSSLNGLKIPCSKYNCVRINIRIEAVNFIGTAPMCLFNSSSNYYAHTGQVLETLL